MAGLLSIPVSNADSERGFSMLRKIHTDQRSNLDQSTIVALMAMKFNCDACCCDMKVSPELLASSKKATTSYVAKQPDLDLLHFTFFRLIIMYSSKLGGVAPMGAWSRALIFFVPEYSILNLATMS